MAAQRRGDYYRNPRQSEYIYGNTARALKPLENDVDTKKKLSGKELRSRERCRSMSFGFAFFLALMMGISGLMCMQYIKLQSSVTSHVATISAMEIELESLRAENDDTECRIKGSVGLEEIKRRAMDELGMTYAKEDQIVVYESDGTDYVRQLVSIE